MKKHTALVICKAVACVLFVLSLIGSIVCAAISMMFSTKAIEKQLKDQGFYTFAMQEIEKNISDLQGVIGVESAAVLNAIPADTVETLLHDYTHTVTENLFTGKQDVATVSFTSNAVYQLVCAAVTPEQYGDDTAQMEADRQDAYADLTAAVNESLAFFPQTLYDKITDALEQSGLRLQTVYTAIHITQKCTIPLILFTVVCSIGIIFCNVKNRSRGLRTAAGCAFITSSVFFLVAVFMRDFSLLNRLSLSDGLLRRYILTIIDNMSSGIFTVVTVAFILAALLLIGAIAWEVTVSRKNTCTDQQTMVQ